MIVEAQVTINGSKAAIWAAITNIENASETISGIEKIEVLEKPANGLVGLRWRETRMLFGKPATAEKWPRRRQQGRPGGPASRGSGLTGAAFERLVMDPRRDLLAIAPSGTDQTLLREIVLAADHAAYHVGQLVVVRRLLGAWPGT